jgi:hypothetical protein
MVSNTGKTVPGCPRRVFREAFQDSGTYGIIGQVDEDRFYFFYEVLNFRNNNMRRTLYVSIAFSPLRTKGTFSPVAAGRSSVRHDKPGGEIMTDILKIISWLVMSLLRYFFAEKSEQWPFSGAANKMICKTGKGVFPGRTVHPGRE